MVMNKKTTIQDIANAAGVSKTTVSRYLNGKYENMSLQTREKIAETISNTGYRPSRIANSLKTNRTNLIGLVLSNVSSSLTPYLLGSITDACVEFGKKVIVINSGKQPSLEQELVFDLLDQQVDGLIVASGYNMEFYQRLHNDGLPIVLIDRIPNHPAIDTIAINHRDGTASVIRHLIHQGFERIILVTRPHHNPNSTYLLREQAVMDTCNACNKRVECMMEVIPNPETFKDTARLDTAIQNCLLTYQRESISCPTAVFIVDALLTSRFILTCAQLQISFTPQFTLAGYDAWAIGQMISPPICTIEQPLTQMGTLATTRLMELINANEPMPVKHALLECLITYPKSSGIL